MSVLEFTPDQVLAMIRRLPADAKRAALLALAEEAESRRDQRMAVAEDRLRQRARERGLDWDRLDDAAREALVDRLLHEP